MDRPPGLAQLRCTALGTVRGVDGQETRTMEGSQQHSSRRQQQHSAARQPSRKPVERGGGAYWYWYCGGAITGGPWYGPCW